jgi:hypothetical protein
MGRKPQSLFAALGAIATLGAAALAVHAAIQIVVVIISVLIGIGVGIFTNWISGVISGIISFAIINKIIYYFDLWDMATNSKATNTTSNGRNTEDSMDA